MQVPKEISERQNMTSINLLLWGMGFTEHIALAFHKLRVFPELKTWEISA